MILFALYIKLAVGNCKITEEDFYRNVLPSYNCVLLFHLPLFLVGAFCLILRLILIVLLVFSFSRKSIFTTLFRVEIKLVRVDIFQRLTSTSSRKKNLKIDQLQVPLRAAPERKL